MSEKEQLPARVSHNIIMENRKTLSISGVKDVDSFNEEIIVLNTELGELTIRGLKLHINQLDQQSGELRMDGEISELVYSELELEPKGLFGRLFR